MKCPICSIELQSIKKNGFNYDYCSKCRGVWLDRIELDNIVKYAEQECTRISLQMTSQRTTKKSGTYCTRKKVQPGSFLEELFPHI